MSSQTYAVCYNFVLPSVLFCELMHVLRADLDTCSYTNRSSAVCVTYNSPPAILVEMSIIVQPKTRSSQITAKGQVC